MLFGVLTPALVPTVKIFSESSWTPVLPICLSAVTSDPTRC